MSPARVLTQHSMMRPALRGLWVLISLPTLCGCVVDNPSRRLVGRPNSEPAVTALHAATAALVQARDLDRRGEARAVDYYYRAAVQSAQSLQQSPSLDAGGGQSEPVYHQALAGLIDAGQRYKRLDPRSQLIVVDGGTRVVPLRYFGFAWQPDDFSRLTSAARHTHHEIAHHIASPGLGLPLVAERFATNSKEAFLPPWQAFAATAVLRPCSDPGGFPGADASAEHVWELYNPLVFEKLDS
jgi:hypothetical protein